MTALAEHQFEILPSAEANDGYVFGIGADIHVNGEGGFDPGSMDWLAQDQNNVRRGVRAFGRDTPGGKSWSWNSHTNCDDVASAVSAIEALSGYWRAPQAMESPGEHVAIRYRIADRERRVFGRPRGFSAPPSNLILSGMVPITHDFMTVDSYTYDDLESSVVVPYASSVEGGGFILPATMPLVTNPSEGNATGQISVGGNAKTYPVIRFNGPWLNPVIDTGTWRIQWTGAILAGGWIEIDTRPWRLTVLDQSGASAVAGIARRSDWSSWYFQPNTQPQIALSGVATGGSASAVVRWRNAWTWI